jgi:hypothetical protein
MAGERAATTRMRERGQICCICGIPLAPPHPWRERRCPKCDRTQRVYLHSHQVRQFWVVQYLEADLRTPIGRMFHYAELERVRAILTRGSADAAAREEFESGIHKWGIGACFLALTLGQYEKLRESKGKLG